MKLLVTGGAGFIGSNFIRYWLREHPNDQVINLDALTYAGNRENLKEFERGSRYRFDQFDITCLAPVGSSVTVKDPGPFDRERFERLVEWIRGVDAVVHFAAESHVDRSIYRAGDFVLTNVYGTHMMLEAAVKAGKRRFHHVSTDEVFGSLKIGSRKKFSETTLYAPRSPYAASKAAADHLVRAYHETFGLPVTISNTSNNFGPYQHPEKLLPLAVTNLLVGEKVPVYGDGKNVRDWLYVEDHCRAVDLILTKGQIGETYCIGGLTEDVSNLDLIRRVLKIMRKDEAMIEFVPDRPGHDRRYAVDWTKAKRELGYAPAFGLDENLERTIRWYEQHPEWWKRIREGSDFRAWQKRQYDQQP